jgi:hypothetical protein
MPASRIHPPTSSLAARCSLLRKTRVMRPGEEEHADRASQRCRMRFADGKTVGSFSAGCSLGLRNHKETARSRALLRPQEWVPSFVAEPGETARTLGIERGEL